jgi:CheY-like chemotaxis protein
MLAAAPEGFDAVLMDLQMPEMDGSRPRAASARTPRFAKVPIIAMTAHALLEERERAWPREWSTTS